MAGKVWTRRWNDPPQAGERGTRILVTRYRPRGVRKEDETWDEWLKDVGPSVELHADFYGKHGAPITLEAYRERYLEEIARDPARFFLAALKNRVAGGEDLVLLCSSACVDETKCHRTILAGLISG